MSHGYRLTRLCLALTQYVIYRCINKGSDEITFSESETIFDEAKVRPICKNFVTIDYEQIFLLNMCMKNCNENLKLLYTGTNSKAARAGFFQNPGKANMCLLEAFTDDLIRQGNQFASVKFI